jgi:hypothetical protein
LLMHVGRSLQDLLHVAYTSHLRMLEAVVHDALKQLAPCNAAGVRVITEISFCPAL